MIEALEFLAKHLNLIGFIIDAIENKGVDPARVRQLVEDEMTDQANAAMRRELGP